MNAHARTKWMRTLGNFSYLLGVAFLIAAMAINAMPVPSARAANATLNCPLPAFDASHYALNPGQSVTCTITDAIFVGTPTSVDVTIVHATLGTVTVTGAVSGSTITFSYTGRGGGCDTEFVRYNNNDGSDKKLSSGFVGFGYPGPCGDPTSTPTTTQEPGPSVTPTDTGTPTDTAIPTNTPTGTLTPTTTSEPGRPTSTPSPLIPVTGANLSGGGTQSIFFNLGIAFLGLGLVLNGLARERKERDV